jgi:cytochrome d ubiquinol oxidase subunit II
MFLIAGLIFRAVAIEFRSKHTSKKWRTLWDTVFCVASTLVAFVLGILIGNMITGIPLDSEQNYIGSFLDLLSPYPILVGLTTVALFAMHGATYLHLKTEGETRATLQKWIWPAIAVFLVWYIVTTIATLLYMPHMIANLNAYPYLFVFPILSVVAILNIPYQIQKGNDGWAFLCSASSIALFLILYGLGTFPTLVPSTLEPTLHSLTIFNAASSPKTLKILLVVVAIGVPLVLAYGFWVYHIFRGKVKLDKSSY